MKKIISFLTVMTVMAIVFIAPIKTSAAELSSKVGVVSTQNTGLIVRSSPSTSGTVLASLPKGGYVTLISNSNGWWYVEYGKGRFGYCSDRYISVTSATAKTVNITSGSLNIRSGAGTGYSIIGSLKKGEVVLELSSSSGWSKIVYFGTKVGYVSSSYLAGASGYKKISLNVPSFKQNDSRWANIKVASSGKTIAQIGCATTAISMMESYRQGKTLTPADMVKTLKYTSSGNVYWPSHYYVTTNTSGYLTKIYNLLSAGKPVLFGAKNSYGKQHWVVITGYNGSSGLSAAGFSINDPGTNTRTNLAQFLSAYPTIYKFFNY